MTATDVPQSFWTMHPWLVVIVGACAVVAAIGGAWRVLRRATSASFDEAVWQSMKRKSPEWEHHMRQRVFKDDLAQREKTARTARAAFRLSRENSQQISQLVQAQTATADAVRDIPPMRETITAINGTLDRVNENMTQLHGSVERVYGIVDEMRRHGGTPARGGVAIPSSATLPSGL